MTSLLLVARALVAAGLSVVDGDVLVVTSKVLSRAEGRFVELPRVEPSARALELAREVGKDPRAVELDLARVDRSLAQGARRARRAAPSRVRRRQRGDRR